MSCCDSEDLYLPLAGGRGRIVVRNSLRFSAGRAHLFLLPDSDVLAQFCVLPWGKARKCLVNEAVNFRSFLEELCLVNEAEMVILTVRKTAF